ncbi:MAG TPA: hypothetical protein VHV81_14860 [Steroidobacteraceae bacterium]|jgi:ElaB/YqjD/DUF883 family membrane-anchored ribosome-binding protein|nr:hypothetical protein [Steroidobacteraceae bacterium]
MVTAPLSSVVQKKDLHIGGLGAEAASTLAAVAEQVPDAAESLARWGRRAARQANDFLRANPWAALAVAAAAGAAAGYLLSQQQRARGSRFTRMFR